MTRLSVRIGQCSDRGRKPQNQDFHGALLPDEPLLGSKGVAIALADGISSSEVSQIASAAAVKGFLDDYYCTTDAWSVRKSAHRVLQATNSWLYAQTRQSQHRFDMDRGYVCTFSALVIKSQTLHLFHIGDTRVYRILGESLEQLTQDHRVWVGGGRSYLGRALGVKPELDLDYQSIPVERGDLFMLATDGLYEFVDGTTVSRTLADSAGDLDRAARRLVERALEAGSDDNITVQLVCIDELPIQEPGELHQRLAALPFAPQLEARQIFDGFRIERGLHASHRSHVYLATDLDSGQPVVIKTPSTDLQQDPVGMERFLTEEWIARRLDSPFVLRTVQASRPRNYLYTASEYAEGQTLAQWMTDHPRPDMETVRGIVEQIAKGLQAFHRMEMLHQDLRPANVLIDVTGTVKIIDFGSTRVAGIVEALPLGGSEPAPGTLQYMAPEYFLGEPGSTRSDQFSLAVITYQMLTGHLPYGTDLPRARTLAGQRRLRYRSALREDREIPAWIDDVLRRALHPLPERRYDALSEFVFELRQPSPAFLSRSRPPLLERNPLLFWKSLCALLVLVIAVLVARLNG